MKVVRIVTEPIVEPATPPQAVPSQPIPLSEFSFSALEPSKSPKTPNSVVMTNEFFERLSVIFIFNLKILTHRIGN